MITRSKITRMFLCLVRNCELRLIKSESLFDCFLLTLSVVRAIHLFVLLEIPQLLIKELNVICKHWTTDESSSSCSLDTLHVITHHPQRG